MEQSIVTHERRSVGRHYYRKHSNGISYATLEETERLLQRAGLTPMVDYYMDLLGNSRWEIWVREDSWDSLPE